MTISKEEFIQKRRLFYRLSCENPDLANRLTTIQEELNTLIEDIAEEMKSWKDGEENTWIL